MRSSPLARVDQVLDRILDAVELEGLELSAAARETLRDEPEAVRRGVEEILGHLAGGPDLLERGVLGAAPALGDRLIGSGAEDEPPVDPSMRRPADEVGDQLGPYRVLGVLGRGGMGVVHLAERDDGQYRQQVAIKRMHASVAGVGVRSRLLRERQILADLDHPAIARLLDGGVSEDGEPYLVMERVEGLPIDEHCESVGAPVEERLRLFLDVCEAVESAHRALVVHRDLKPSNILVTENGSVKLLDFGIAGLLEPDDGEPTQGRTLVRAFTVESASPEQVRGDRAGVPSDVYSLGVLLYRLLTSRPPYETEGLEPSEVARRVCEQDPKPPSRKVLEASEGEPARPRLARRLRGDLDHVVLKALAKEPRERYGSVGDFAADLRRHLEGLPVDARAASVGYRARKFARRHRVGVAAAVAVAASLVLGLALTAIQARRAAAERDRARAEAVKAETVASFLTELFDAADPYSSEPSEPSVRELLERGERRIATELADQPAVRADLLGAMGRAYRGLGDWQRAEELASEALELRRAEPRSDPVALARTLMSLASVRESQGDLEGASELYAEAVTRLEEGGKAATFEMADAVAGMARPRSVSSEEKERLYRRALELRAELGDESSSPVARLLQDLGVVYEERGDLERSIRLKSEALELLEAELDPEHPMVHIVTNNLATAHWKAGDLVEAERLFQLAADGLERRLGAGHPDLANTYSNLGKILLELGRLPEAARYVESAVELGGAPGSFSGVAQQVNLATLRREQGRVDEAISIYERARLYFRERLGVDHPAVARVESLMGQALRLAGDERRAEHLLRGALEIQQQGPPADLALAETRRELGGILCGRGEPEAGSPLVEAGCAGSDARPEADPLRAAKCSLERAVCRLEAGDRASARGLLAKAETLLPESLPADHPAATRRRALAARAGDGGP